MRHLWIPLLILPACGEKDDQPVPVPNPDPVATFGDPGEPVGPLLPRKTAADYPDLVIETLVEGDGEVFEHGMSGQIHYTGVLLNGKQFDSSIGKDPFSLQTSPPNAIMGWILGVEGMKVGEKRRLRIPSELAYGERGRPPDIPGNATLVFMVELVEITR